MFFRRTVISKVYRLLSPHKKELLLIFLIGVSLLSGWYEESTKLFHSSQSDRVWNVNGPQNVKGTSIAGTDVSLNEHFQEIEIVPVKYEPPPQVTPPPPQDSDTREWGVATQVDEYTWTMNVEHDSQMATASEIISALNAYRVRKGSGSLSFDQKLGEYAQSRADFFASQGGMDSHAGFQDFITNQDGFTKVGFFSLGENSSFGYQLEATHLIEWVFAGDAPHDTNQLNPEWTHVGVGVNGTAVDIIFAGRKQ